MNELPTPETDAESCYPDSNLGECVCADFARKLERERDEAREEQDKAKTELEMWRDGNILHEIHRNGLEKAERERDEARDTIMKIEEIFIDSEDMHDDWMKVGNIARTFCEKYI